MSQEQRVRFLEELQKLVTYYAREYSLSYPEMMGCLDLVHDHLSEDARHGKQEGEEWKV